MANLPPGAQIQPIDSLTSFMNGQWWIKARVTDKSDIRTWNKPNSTGKLFSCTLVDQSSSIRATMFQEAVDTFFPMLTPGQIYYFSGGQVKTANKKFSNVNNDYELTFDSKSQIIPARNDMDSMNIPTMRYNFVPIQILKQREANSVVDVLAVVTQVGEIGKIVQKATQKELIKRTVKIADMTAAIDLTVWEETAKQWNVPVGTVIALRQVRVGSYDGVTLGSTQQTQYDANPNIPDTRKLSDWFVSTGGADVTSLSVQGGARGDGDFENFRGRKFFEDIAAEGLGRGLKPDFIDVRCTPVYLKTDTMWYDACPTCNKKVTAVGAQADMFKCEKCDRNVNPMQRYLVTIQASDNVGQIWLTLFNEAAESFFGISAGDFKRRMDIDPNFASKIAQARLYRPVLMRIRVVEERNQQNADQEERLRCTVTKITEILQDGAEGEGKPKQVGALKDECQHLLQCIEAY